MIKIAWLRVLLQRKMWVILALGFASGLPLGLCGSTLQTWFALEGVNIKTIGFLSLLSYPYTCKFLWAPLLDRGQFSFLGHRRSWMLITQIALIITLVIMGFSQPAVHPYPLAFLAFCLAFFSATQDIAIDAYRTEILTAEERGIGTSTAVAGYRIAMWVSGGLTLILAHYLGFSITYLLMAVLMMVGFIATLLAKPTPIVKTSTNFFRACIDPWKEFLTRPNAVALLLFILVYKLGDVFANGLSQVFLIKEIGFSLVEIGSTYKIVGSLSTIGGIFVGGAVMVKLGLFRSLLLFGIAQALTNFLFFAFTYMGANFSMLIATIVLENFGGGLGTAAYLALIMSLCKPPYTATQFALLTALSAVGRTVGGGSGVLVEWLGWSEFFLWTVVFAIPGLLLLCWLRKTIDASEEESITLEPLPKT